MTESSIHVLTTVTAPDAFGTRGLPKATKPKTRAFWEHYDNTTLIYDCVAIQSRGIIRMTMPKLLGFKQMLLGARFTVDGKEIKRKKIRQNRKHDVLDLYIAHPGRELIIAAEGITQSVPVQMSDPSRFAGCNVLYTQVKNDNLDWVYDWGRAHQRNHGVNAILVTNNGSTAYSSEELRRVLMRIPHIKVADVLDAPLRYGAHHSTCKGGGFSEFLQPALQNALRDRFFEQARAVLLCDVDELVLPVGTETIFDATVGSWLKYKPFNGFWRYAQLSDTPVRHADHVYSKPNDSKCASKYCIVPDSLLGRMSWGVHSLEAINRHIFRPANRFQFLHCRQIATSWKSDRSRNGLAGATLDTDSQAFMAKTFETDPMLPLDEGQPQNCP